MEDIGPESGLAVLPVRNQPAHLDGREERPGAPDVVGVGVGEHERVEAALCRVRGDVGGVGFDTQFPFGIYPESAVVIFFCIIFATLAAGIYPAWKAGRVEPVDSIKLV